MSLGAPPPAATGLPTLHSRVTIHARPTWLHQRCSSNTAIYGMGGRGDSKSTSRGSGSGRRRSGHGRRRPGRSPADGDDICRSLDTAKPAGSSTSSAGGCACCRGRHGALLPDTIPQDANSALGADGVASTAIQVRPIRATFQRFSAASSKLKSQHSTTLSNATPLAICRSLFVQGSSLASLPLRSFLTLRALEASIDDLFRGAAGKLNHLSLNTATSACTP